MSGNKVTGADVIADALKSQVSNSLIVSIIFMCLCCTVCYYEVYFNLWIALLRGLGPGLMSPQSRVSVVVIAHLGFPLISRQHQI